MISHCPDFFLSELEHCFVQSPPFALSKCDAGIYGCLKFSSEPGEMKSEQGIDA